jgi:hypothetical protein
MGKVMLVIEMIFLIVIIYYFINFLKDKSLIIFIDFIFFTY